MSRVKNIEEKRTQIFVFKRKCIPFKVSYMDFILYPSCVDCGLYVARQVCVVGGREDTSGF